jgi:hypothetical protein
VILELPRIDPQGRRDEQGFWNEFAGPQPGILGALLTAASAALKNLPLVKASKSEWPGWDRRSLPGPGTAPGYDEFQKVTPG